MSSSSSGLRGVTLNDLFVVPAKRATDMRSLAEVVVEKGPREKRMPALELLLHNLLDALTYVAIAAVSFTLSDWTFRSYGKSSHFLQSLNAECGADLARLMVAAVFFIVALMVFNETGRDWLQKLLPISVKKDPDVQAGYIARATLTRGALSLGPLKVTYSITPDALVIRSLKDHAVTVVSMEMASRAIVGNADVVCDSQKDLPANRDSEAYKKIKAENDDRAEIRKLGITKGILRSWYGPKHTYPVVISLKTGDMRTPLFIHGLYFDGQASEEKANEVFVREFTAALDAFQAAQNSHSHALSGAHHH